MAFYTPAGTKVLNLPEQVQKNLEDIADLKTAVDTKQDASTAVTKESLTTDISGKDVDLGATSVTSLTNTGNTTNNGTLDQEGTATFGSDVEVDGNVTLNSPENIKFKTGSLDFSELTSFIDTYYANAYNFRYGGTVFDIYEIGTNYFDFRRSGFSDLAKATSAIGMFQGAIFDIEYITAVVHIYIPKFANVNNHVNDMSLFRNVTVRHGSNVTDPKIHVHVSAARLGVSGFRMFEYDEQDATWLKEVDAELMDDGVSYPKLYNPSEMFDGCTALEVVGYFDMSSAYSVANMFRLCSSLKEIHCTHWKNSFNISASTQFEEADLVEIIGNLDTVSTAQTLTMGSTNLAKLTEDEILVATGKGWTLA